MYASWASRLPSLTKGDYDMKRLLVLGVAAAGLAFGSAAYAQNSQNTFTNPTGDQKNGVGGFQPYAGGASSKTNTMTTNNGGVGGFQPYGGGASTKTGQQKTGDQGATPPKTQ
jgi:hypothetical protein